jgi:hypothetical protein
MPLDDTWWSLTGPFKDNSEGDITAETMREFAKAIADHAVTGSWFNIAFTTPTVVSSQWTTVDVTKVLWLTKTAPFVHSDEWTVEQDVNLIDTFIYGLPGDLTLQVTFNPVVIGITGAVPGGTMTPVAGVTDAKTDLLTTANTYTVGPTVNITSATQNLDISGFASVLRADTERAIRFGLKFVPAATKAIGTSSFNVNPTTAGVSVVARPLAPSV